jgi:hypothetical protein
MVRPSSKKTIKMSTILDPNNTAFFDVSTDTDEDKQKKFDILIQAVRGYYKSYLLQSNPNYRQNLPYLDSKVEILVRKVMAKPTECVSDQLDSRVSQFAKLVLKLSE